jgi:hypothetical protein
VSVMRPEIQPPGVVCNHDLVAGIGVGCGRGAQPGRVKLT